MGLSNWEQALANHGMLEHDEPQPKLPVQELVECVMSTQYHKLETITVNDSRNREIASNCGFGKEEFHGYVFAQMKDELYRYVDQHIRCTVDEQSPRLEYRLELDLAVKA